MSHVPRPLTTATMSVTSATRARPPSAIAAPIARNGTVLEMRWPKPTCRNGAAKDLRQAVDVARMDAVVVEPMVGGDVDDLQDPHEADHRDDEQQRVRAVGSEAVGHPVNATGA